MTMINASERAWNSPTTLYLARRLSSLARNARLTVLDLGCGDGTVLEQLLDYGHDLFGCDLPELRDAVRGRLAPRLGAAFEERVRVVEDGRTIPFADDTFDAVYANQVFEHVRDLDMMLTECGRVLRPGGTLLATFPPSTCPLEVHLRIPFAHWLPPGRFRARYLQVFYGLGLRPRLKGRTARETAVHQDAYLREQTFPRTAAEVFCLGGRHFGRVAWETGQLMTAKLDLMEAAGGPAVRLAADLGGLANGPLLRYLVTRLAVAACSFSAPRRR